MCILEIRIKFEAETEHSIHTDVRDPDDRKWKQYGSVDKEEESKQEERDVIGMSRIIDKRAKFRILGIADHKNIWHE